MAARVRRGDGPPGDEPALLARLAEEGWSSGHGWGNGPHERYAAHTHDYDKALYCVRGGVAFETDDGEAALAPGDRLELESGTAHSAVVGPEGVRCVEAHRY
ncbi:MAG: cupin domain-containing protein [Egibacteraceae bacterium]